MIYDVTADGYDFKPRRVFDADGVEINFVVKCDTESGEAVTLKLNEKGAPYEDPRNLGETAKEYRKYKSPLRVVEE